MKSHSIFKIVLQRLSLIAWFGGLAFHAVAVPILNPSNGHYYESVTQTVDWLTAKTLAENLSFSGYQGHLASITSANENDFIVQNVSPINGYWLGGFQPSGSLEPDGGWQWVTGESFSYSNWAPGEPNDIRNDQYLHFSNDVGNWNDQQPSTQPGFIVEYSPVSVPEHTNWTIFVAAAAFIVFCSRPFGKSKELDMVKFSS